MGTRNSKPIVPPNEVKQKINPKTKEYENIKLHFQQLSKTYDLTTGRISKDLFISSYLQPRLPSFSTDLLERFFIVLAFGGKDYIIFEEFIATKYLLEHIPPEPHQIIAKAADDFYTEEDVIYEYRLRLLFNLFDLDFNGFISMKEYQKVIPFLMQNDLYRKIDEEEMNEYDEWFSAITQFAFMQFDRQQQQRLNWRDFRALSRHDLTVKNIMDIITPKHEEYDCLKYAKAIQRKNEKKKSKKDRKKKDKLNQQNVGLEKDKEDKNEEKKEGTDDTAKETTETESEDTVVKKTEDIKVVNKETNKKSDTNVVKKETQKTMT